LGAEADMKKAEAQKGGLSIPFSSHPKRALDLFRDLEKSPAQIYQIVETLGICTSRSFITSTIEIYRLVLLIAAPTTSEEAVLLWRRREKKTN
jgi:hypothetical protein